MPKLKRGQAWQAKHGVACASNTLGREDMKTMWAVYDDGLRVWANGNLVATIPEQDFSHLIAEIAQCKRYQIDDGPNLAVLINDVILLIIIEAI